jgi:hypothetical protein
MGICNKVVISIALFALLVAAPIRSAGQQLRADGADAQGRANAHIFSVSEWAGLIKDLIVAAAAAITAVAAWRGLSVWRKETKGRRSFEVARRLLRNAYQIEAAVRSFRNPLQRASEIEEAHKELGLDESKRQDAFESTKAVYELRWRHLGEAWANFNASAVEARVLWGDEAQEWLRPLSECVKQLWGSLRGGFVLSTRSVRADSRRTSTRRRSRRLSKSSTTHRVKGLRTGSPRTWPRQ